MAYAQMPKIMPSKKRAGRKTGRAQSVFFREGEARVKVANSGLEVWLYDEQNLNILCESPAFVAFLRGEEMPLKVLFEGGLLVSYSLYQDDALDVAVLVGPPLSEQELSVSRWLAPQRAFLQVPSGRLCIESNDSLRLNQE